jgi:uncharacterized protein YraI
MKKIMPAIALAAALTLPCLAQADRSSSPPR